MNDASPPRSLLRNGRVFDGRRILEESTVLLDGGRIAAVGDTPPADGAAVVDLAGGLLHRRPVVADQGRQQAGGAEAAVRGGDRADACGIGRGVEQHAAAAVHLDVDEARRQQAAAAVEQALQDGIPGVRGIHFEGPYINPARRGAHAATPIRPPDPEAVALFGNGRMGAVVVTLAPERVPAELIAALARAGVRVCAGHSAADYDTVRAALAAGLSGFTHLFNAMPPLAGRAPGVLGAALEDRSSWCGIIADGHHVHWAGLRLALRCKPRGKVMLVSDAMPSVGARETQFAFAGETVRAAGGVCRMPDGTLAGSDLSMAQAVRNAATELDVTLEEALRMASLYPAAFLGLDDRIGRIAPGYAADLVLLDDALQVQGSWIGGRHAAADAAAPA